MHLIFLGPPGVGKGTQAKRICDRFDIIHLSTGEILRTEIAVQSNVGNQAKLYKRQDIMDNRLRINDAQKGYLLDGFPRTIPQAEGLEKIMKKLSHPLKATVSLSADEDALVQRLINRSLESGRSDDAPDIIRQRQKVYWEQTAPLLDYYRSKNLLKEVNGIGEISKITERILEVLI